MTREDQKYKFASYTRVLTCDDVFVLTEAVSIRNETEWRVPGTDGGLKVANL